jgi:small subunit ribosomal protein S17
MTESTQPQQTKKTKAMKREFQGNVVSAPKNKTIQVVVRFKKMHPVYKKQYWVSKKYPVHDEGNSANIGDTVLFKECRPLSKTKRWYLLRVVNG